MAITYFPVTGNWAGFPQGSALNGSVTFTPNLPIGSVALDTSHDPPLGEVSASTQAVIVNGVLLVTPSGGTVELLANTADLNLDGTLQYVVEFGPIVVDGQPVHMDGFAFDAPVDSTGVDLILVTPAGFTALNWVPQVPISGITDAGATGRALLASADQTAAWAALGTVPSGSLPSYVDDVLEYANRAAFPVTGETAKIYVALDTGLWWRWSGSLYIEGPVLGFVQAAKNPDVLVTGAITLDGSNLITSAVVAWPDGSPGTLTITSRDTNSAVLAYNITYGGPVSKTYTQPTITRNAAGAATNVPAIVVS